MTKDEALKMAIGKLVLEKMTSGNDVPVSRCTITNVEIHALSKEALEQPAQSDVDLELKQFSKNLIDRQIQDEHPLSSEQLWGLYETEQPAQEPVAYNFEGVLFFANEASHYMKDSGQPLYTHPHQWQGLTDDEMWEIEAKCLVGNPADWEVEPKRFARAIEQALKEKNT